MGRIEYAIILLSIVIAMAVLSADHVVSSDAVLAIYGAIVGANGVRPAANLILNGKKDNTNE